MTAPSESSKILEINEQYNDQYEIPDIIIVSMADLETPHEQTRSSKDKSTDHTNDTNTTEDIPITGKPQSNKKTRAGKNTKTDTDIGADTDVDIDANTDAAKSKPNKSLRKRPPRKPVETNASSETKKTSRKSPEKKGHTKIESSEELPEKKRPSGRRTRARAKVEAADTNVDTKANSKTVSNTDPSTEPNTKSRTVEAVEPIEEYIETSKPAASSLAHPFVLNPHTNVLEFGMMVDYMKHLQQHMKTDECIHDIFHDPRLEFINSTIRNGNYYAMDKYGLLIRAKERGKAACAWRFDENDDPINVHVKNALIRLGDAELIQRTTLQSLKRNPRFSRLFADKDEKQRMGIIRKIYSVVFPDLDFNSF